MPQAAPIAVDKKALAKHRLAEQLVQAGRDDEARPLLMSLTGVQDLAPVVLFRLGEIWNRDGRPTTSFEYHVDALSADAALAARITPEDHPQHGYRFTDSEQEDVDSCPLCGRESRPHWAFNMLTNRDFNPGFHPVRLWMLCRECRHLHTARYPADLARVLTDSENDMYRTPRLDLLPHLAETVGRLRELAPGPRLLDVGVGGGELLAVAGELGLEATGLDIRPLHSRRVAETLDRPVICADFATYTTADRVHMLCMGDVLEHLIDPGAAVARAAALLPSGGVLWLSTPNFESAFSCFQKDRDPMKRVCEHLNYFSFASLRQVLTAHGLEVVDYRLSRHYNGSMEVTAVKR